MSEHAMANSQSEVPRERVIVGWSGGKDSTLALQRVQSDPELDVAALVTTVTAGYDRISMHGVRRSLLRRQCEALGLPLVEAPIPIRATNAEYEAATHAAFSPFVAAGVRRAVFGDLFLQDIRAYRERQCAEIGLACHFPLWLADTRALASSFIAQGFRAIVVCVDPAQIDPAFCGREYDDALLADLPPTADPCGERGEFHTFVYDGPLFQCPVAVTRGDVVTRDGFCFCDLMLD